MGRKAKSVATCGTTFELSTEERRRIVERLHVLYDWWASRLRDVSSGGLTIAELGNLYDNLVFDADHASDPQAPGAFESLIARMASALEEAGGEEYVPPELLPLYHEIVGLTDAFCQQRLNDEYRPLCRRAAVALCQPGSPAVRGKPSSWACGVVSAVGWVNFLTDPNHEPHIRAEEIAEWFGVSVATMHNKSKMIREGLDLTRFHPDFTLPSRMANNPIFQLSSLLANVPSLELLADAAEGPAVAEAEHDKDLGFVLKITLQEVKPPVWRRVQTPDCTLEELHEITQTVMGWRDGHLHEFRVGETRIVSTAMDEFEVPPEGSRLEADVWLGDLHAAGEKRLDYLYDFGDGWEHAIVIEKALPGEAVGEQPLCTDGARACPPEDVGGPWGYADFLAAMADPKHERHAELMEWYADEFDAERFDAEEINRLLGELFE